MDDDALLTEQLAYYRAGAAEYDRPYAEREDLRELLAAVDDLPIAGDVLELACGTGQWTSSLAARARSVTAVDAAAEVLALARARTASATVRFVEADLFAWQPSRCYDTVFFAFWLSHIPPARLPGFWNTVASALAPGGKAVFIDDGPAAAAEEEVLSGRPTPVAVRRLDDGSRYRIVKVFHDPSSLTTDLAALGWSAHIRLVAGKFIGVAEPPATSAREPARVPRGSDECGHLLGGLVAPPADGEVGEHPDGRNGADGPADGQGRARLVEHADVPRSAAAVAGGAAPHHGKGDREEQPDVGR